ncbi:helix-turn-helix domain-containing protein [Novacetimonas maltaceti]|uniref:Helix-turn-helix domain-containing protein n=1 Tax=Novacetimonas maltaceti TaxID=1203393 RepID=A0A2S3VX43_9PROT|nr:helix-turn-helix domain-containing protein [Novacetimonas maltaceti]POF61204.1 hypothetical protein KMAL_31800 [Novacetimonas maltaceti]
MHISNERSELLYGADKIGKFLGLNPRQIRRRFKAGQLPGFHFGRLICASADDLREWLASAAHGGIDAQ